MKSFTVYPCNFKIIKIILPLISRKNLIFQKNQIKRQFSALGEVKESFIHQKELYRLIINVHHNILFAVNIFHWSLLKIIKKKKQRRNNRIIRLFRFFLVEEDERNIKKLHILLEYIRIIRNNF